MSIQSNVGAQIIAASEDTFGAEAAANAASAHRIRRVGSSLATVKGAFASNEVRRDQQVSDMRHGGQGVQGSIEAELSTGSFDPFLQALMRGTWTAGVSSTQSPWTSPNVGFAASGGAHRATFGASGASLITLGYRVGDVVAFSGLSGGAAVLNGVHLRVLALTATTLDFTPIKEDFSVPTSATNASWTLAVVGAKLTNGIVKRSFTIEQSYDDIDVSELFSGLRVGGGNINIPPNGNATASFSFQGRRGRILKDTAAPYFSAPAAEGVSAILNGLGGDIRLNGSDQQVITGFSLSVNLNLTAPPVIGTPFVPEIFYGRTVATGSVSAFLQDEKLIAAFLNENSIEVCPIITGDTPDGDFISLNMQRVKFTGAQKQLGPEGGLIVNFPFQALLNTGEGEDTTTLAIQRSNAIV